jgi:hypothetical protein
LVVVLHVGLNRQRLDACALDLCGKVFGVLGGLAVIDRYAGDSRLCQAPHHRAADAARAAGDQSHSAVKFHVCLALGMLKCRVNRPAAI